jgi:hypothetical protein
MNNEPLDTDELDAARAEQKRQDDMIYQTGDFDDPRGKQEFSIPFDESYHPDERILEIESKARHALAFYRAGWHAVVQNLVEHLEILNDNDMAALSFRDFIERTKASADVKATRIWADKQDLSDILTSTENAVKRSQFDEAGIVIPFADETQPQGTDSTKFKPLEASAEDLKRIYDLADREPGSDELPDIEKATRQDFSEYSRTDLELLLSENMQLVENLASTAKRDDMATDLWAEIASFFNEVMADEPEQQLDMPFMQRIFAFVERLKKDSKDFTDRLKTDKENFAT